VKNNIRDRLLHVQTIITQFDVESLIFLRYWFDVEKLFKIYVRIKLATVI